MTTNHIADGEEPFEVNSVTPDICEVDGAMVAFDITQTMSSEGPNYAHDTYARGERVLRVGSVVRGVKGNCGKGAVSGVSKGKGNNFAISGEKTVVWKKKPIVRHGELFVMNTTAPSLVQALGRAKTGRGPKMTPQEAASLRLRIIKAQD